MKSYVIQYITADGKLKVEVIRARSKEEAVEKVRRTE